MSTPYRQKDIPDKIEGLWEHVEGDAHMPDVDRDRAVEYVRKNCKDKEVFKLFLSALSIASSQVKYDGKSECLEILADFTREKTMNDTDKPFRYVAMNLELRKEKLSGKQGVAERSFFDITLLVDANGAVVDIDCKRLASQIQSKSVSARRIM